MYKYLKKIFAYQFSRRYILIIFLAGIVFSCQTDEEIPKPIYDNEFLISSQEISAFTQSEIQQLAIISGFQNYVDFIETGISIHKIDYNTTYLGNKIKASGLIVLPEDVNENTPLLSVQHGTIFSNADAPSEMASKLGASGLELFSAAGFISIVPDYIGYGSSNQVLHPYYQFEETTNSIIDLIYATREYLRNEDIPYKKELFLTGYSEGGYTTLATQRAFEEIDNIDLELIAVAAGAGGYDINGVLDEILIMETYPVPAYLVLITYSTYINEGWNEPLTNYFQEPYASRIPTLFNGDLNQSQINAQLTDEIGNLFNVDLLEELKNMESHPLRTAFDNNSLIDWTPLTRLRLYHSKNDDVIPFENSVSTANQLIENGGIDVTFIEVGGNSHGGALIPMLDDVIPWFVDLK